jgi:hypothetical protein
MIIRMSLHDVEKILDVEKHSFTKDISANQETIEKRLNMGHTYLCYEQNGIAIATLAFRYAKFNHLNINEFPQTFHEYADGPNDQEPNAMFIYSLGVKTQFRNGITARILIRSAITEAKNKNIEFMVGDGRCPSYNGSKEEGIAQNTHFREIIDQNILSGSIPSEKEITEDPTMAFYKRVTGCSFLWILSDFIPSDEASGGFRIIMYKRMHCIIK